MTFFYDLNKRLADLAKKQDLTESVQSVQSEAKTKRLPGLPITQKDVEKKFGGSMIKMAQAAKDAGFSDARIAQAMDDLKQGKNPNDVAEADYSAKKARAGKDIGKPGKMFGKIAKSAGERYGSKERGEKVAGAVLAKLRAKEAIDPSLEESDMDESALQAYLGKKKYGETGMKALQKAGREGASKETMAKIRAQHDKMNEADMEEGNEFSGELVKARAQGAKEFKVDGKSYPVKEGGTPMTPKQKSFAKLAPPVDKITFADKIAGAKKEVDEMLGDVAAEAMKKAVTGRLAGNSEVDEGFGEMDAWLKSREKEKGTGKFDKRERTLPSGMKATTYTRKMDDLEDEPTDADGNKIVRGRGRPKGKDKGPERVTGKSYKYKAGRPGKAMEGNMDPADSGEYDREGDMAKEQMHTIMSAAKELHRILRDDENLPEWVQKKITLAKEYIDTARDYMLTQHAERGEEQPIAEKAVSKKQQRFMGMVHAAQKGERPASGAVAKVAKDMGKKDAKDFASTKHKGLPEKVKEEGTDKEDQHAERAGKKVTKDLEYDMKHKGKDDSKAERAGKKVTKDIEYDDKKDRKEKKEEKVQETTVSGSVSTASTAPKAAKGGMQYGKGVYEGFNKSVETLITEGMSINISVDEQGKKTMNVNATDEDAEALAQLLKMAGLGSQGHECKSCGQAPCGCDSEMVDENSPDWPTNTEKSMNALQYSGGLNGPKSTGQSTTPVLASQIRRQVSMEETVNLERNLFKTWTNYKG